MIHLDQVAEQLVKRVKAARSLGITTIDITVPVAEALVDERRRILDAFGRLSAVVSALDFDATESAIPETQENWIEFVRSVQESAEKVIDETGL